MMLLRRLIIINVDNIDASGLLKKTDYNTKITEIESKIPDISNLATKAALTTVENKIPDISSLVKKSDCDRKITEVENNIKKLLILAILEIKIILMKTVRKIV